MGRSTSRSTALRDWAFWWTATTKATCCRSSPPGGRPAHAVLRSDPAQGQPQLRQGEFQGAVRGDRAGAGSPRKSVKSAHLYHAHPPTGWIAVRGQAPAALFDLNKLDALRLRRPARHAPGLSGQPRRHLYVSRRSQPMPFYYRNADGDELIFVHRGSGAIETDFGPLTVRARRLLSSPARRDLPHGAGNAG
jgi:hypothetical protein